MIKVIIESCKKLNETAIHNYRVGEFVDWDGDEWEVVEINAEEGLITLENMDGDNRVTVDVDELEEGLSESKKKSSKKESSGFLMMDAPVEVFEPTRAQWKEIIEYVGSVIHTTDRTLELRGTKSMLRDIEKKLKELGFRTLKRDLEESNSKKLTESGWDYVSDIEVPFKIGFVVSQGSSISQDIINKVNSELNYYGVEVKNITVADKSVINFDINWGNNDEDDIEDIEDEVYDVIGETLQDSLQDDEMEESKKTSKKESAEDHPAVKKVKEIVAREFRDFTVKGPVPENYDYKEGKHQFFIAVPEDSLEGREVEKMLQRVESEFSDFEYEGRDWDNRYWFNIDKE